MLGELSAQLGAGWHTRAGLAWNPHQGSNGTIDQSLVELGYRDGDHHVQCRLPHAQDVTEQTDFAAFWPLGRQASLIGRYNYSLRDNRVIEALAGVEYRRAAGGCVRWCASTLTARETTKTSPSCCNSN